MNNGTVCSVELWIELKLREGHVECLVDDSFYGFWPDLDRKNRVEGAVLGKGGNPAFGGWAGYLSKRSEEQLYIAYLSQCHFEKGFMAERPEFSIFCFSTSVEQRNNIKERFEALAVDPPEYDLRSRGTAFNCVSLAVNIFKQFGILPADFRVSKNIPSPKNLNKALDTLSKTTTGISRSETTIPPARFKKQEVLSR